MPVLAIDPGMTGVTALVVGEDGAVLARGYREFPRLFPRPGWVVPAVHHRRLDLGDGLVHALRRGTTAGVRETPTRE
jgi:glycerol kinase